MEFWKHLKKAEDSKYNNENEDNSSNSVSDKNYQVSSEKFKRKFTDLRILLKINIGL